MFSKVVCPFLKCMADTTRHCNHSGLTA
jgi:hypothetical protein